MTDDEFRRLGQTAYDTGTRHDARAVALIAATCTVSLIFWGIGLGWSVGAIIGWLM